MPTTVLVLNSGSSSLKYQLVQPVTGESLFDGIVERIGEETSRAKLNIAGERIVREGPVPDHEAALLLAFDLVADYHIPPEYEPIITDAAVTWRKVKPVTERRTEAADDAREAA